jgi:hypothetical protein
MNPAPPPSWLNRPTDKPTPVWDMSQERAFLETLMNHRFNFFMAFVGLIAAAAINCPNKQYFITILWMGFIIALLLMFALIRAHLKLQTIFIFLKEHETAHPLSYVDSRHKPYLSARKVIGLVIPGVCVAFLGTMAIGATIGQILPPKEYSATPIHMPITAADSSEAKNATTNNLVNATSTTIVSLDYQTRAWLDRRSKSNDVWIGGIIGLAAAVVGGWFSHFLQTKKHKADEKAFTDCLQKSLRLEIQVLDRLYRDAIGKEVEGLRENGLLKHRFSLHENWFTVFEQNAGHLARLPADVATAIIRTYLLIKALIEEFRINNAYIEEWQRALLLQNNHKELSEALNHMESQAREIRQADAALKASVEDLFRLWEKNGIEQSPDKKPQ